MPVKMCTDHQRRRTFVHRTLRKWHYRVLPAITRRHYGYLVNQRLEFGELAGSVAVADYSSLHLAAVRKPLLLPDAYLRLSALNWRHHIDDPCTESGLRVAGGSRYLLPDRYPYLQF